MYGIKIQSFVSVALKFVKEEKKEKRLGLASKHYMYGDLGVRKKRSQDGTRTCTSCRNADSHTGALTNLATEAQWERMLGSVPFMVNLPTSLYSGCRHAQYISSYSTHKHTLRGWIN